MFSSISLGSILGIVKGLLAIGSKIADYMNDKQLIDAGKAEKQAEYLKEARKNVQEAIDARNRATDKLDDDGGVPEDYKHFRD